MDGRVRSEKGEIKTTTTTTSTQKNHASKAKRNESIFLVGITGTYLQRVNLCRKLPASLRLALQRLLSCTSKLAHNSIGLAVQDVRNYRESSAKANAGMPNHKPTQSTWSHTSSAARLVASCCCCMSCIERSRKSRSRRSERHSAEMAKREKGNTDFCRVLTTTPQVNSGTTFTKCTTHNASSKRTRKVYRRTYLEQRQYRATLPR